MASSEDVPAARPGPAKTSKRATAAAPQAPETLVVVTLKMSDGSIQTIEAVDPGGARHELTAAEAAKLLGNRPNSTVEGLVHQAFEAGIAYVLDDGQASAADEEAAESREDAALHDELLDALIERSPAKRLLRREVLNSALLGTIISGASGGTPAAAG
jgi:hypothetical protein